MMEGDSPLVTSVLENDKCGVTRYGQFLEKTIDPFPSLCWHLNILFLFISMTGLVENASVCQKVVDTALSNLKMVQFWKDLVGGWTPILVDH